MSIFSIDPKSHSKEDWPFHSLCAEVINIVLIKAILDIFNVFLCVFYEEILHETYFSLLVCLSLLENFDQSRRDDRDP